MTSVSTPGFCEWAWGFHITSGNYRDVPQDGLNVAMFGRAPGIMAKGNWSVALYLDERASAQQRQAVLPQVVVDNSDFSPPRLTGHCDTPYDTETVPATHFK